MIGAEENQLKDFIVGCLKSGEGTALLSALQNRGCPSVQNLIENLVWTLLHPQSNKRSINPDTMGLFIPAAHELHQTRAGGRRVFDLEMRSAYAAYIEEHYREGSLSELAEELHPRFLHLKPHDPPPDREKLH